MPQEGGLRNQRITFIRESEIGVTPTNPEHKLFSDNISSFDWSPDGNISEQRGIGSVDPKGFYAGVESHTLKIVYDLQKFFIKGGTPNDAAHDGMVRTLDNELPASHTIIQREKHFTGGVAGNGFHTYTVAQGGKIGSVNLSGDPGSNDPIPVTLDYTFTKIRSYKINQPATSTALTVKANDSADEGINITIEDEGANTSETIAITQAGATTTATFESIDAIWLDSETIGTVTIEDGSGNLLAEINGKSSYDGIEGDRGIPPLGSGSFETEINKPYQRFLGDKIERPSGTEFAYDINSVELTIDNSLDTIAVSNRKGMKITETIRSIELTATIFGESASHDKILEHMQVIGQDVIWTMDNGKITIPSAVLTETGGRSIEEGQARMELNNKFVGRGLELTELT